MLTKRGHSFLRANGAAASARGVRVSSRALGVGSLLVCWVSFSLLAAGAAFAEAADDVAAQLAKLSLRAKVGQVFMVTTGEPGLGPSTARFLSALRPGGVTLFGYHLRERGGLRARNAALRRAVPGVPPFVAIDQEGGPVSRLRTPELDVPGAATLGALRNAALASEIGAHVGQVLAAHGIDMNLAPVLDVPREGGGRYLARRAFGASPAQVTLVGRAYVSGLQEAGVAAVAKHFPGEGTSRGDPHRGFPRATADRERLVKEDGRPFAASGADAVMVGHVVFPALGEGPASLQPAVYRLLRELVGAEVVAMTDGLEMRSIRARYGVEHAAVMALRAGADMVSVFWSPTRVLRARDAVLRAVASGALPMARLDEAVTRVLRAKQRRGLLGTRARRGAEVPMSQLAQAARRLWLRAGMSALMSSVRAARGSSAAPLGEGTRVVSHAPAVLAAAGARGIDLRRQAGRAAVRALARGEHVIIAGARGEDALVRRLVARGVQVVRVRSGMAPRSPLPAARASATTYFVGGRALVPGAVLALLGQGDRTLGARRE